MQGQEIPPPEPVPGRNRGGIGVVPAVRVHLADRGHPSRSTRSSSWLEMPRRRRRFKSLESEVAYQKVRIAMFTAAEQKKAEEVAQVLVK
ncbi:hypothetical protein DVH05_007129 [Phytophthora capsici]|nr:hypothetical protein DVH05_007129 [Phytophthora capsici]